MILYIFTVEGIFDVMGGKRKYFCPSEKIKMKDGSKYPPCDVSYFSLGTAVNWRCAVVIRKLVISQVCPC